MHHTFTLAAPETSTNIPGWIKRVIFLKYRDTHPSQLNVLFPFPEIKGCSRSQGVIFGRDVASLRSRRSVRDLKRAERDSTE